MSVHVTSLIWESTEIKSHAGTYRIKPSEKLVLLQIADNSGRDGRCAYCCFSRIARETAMSRTGVIRIISRLEKLGALEVERVAGHAKNSHNNYTLNLPVFACGKVGGRGVRGTPHEVYGVHLGEVYGVHPNQVLIPYVPEKPRPAERAAAVEKAAGKEPEKPTPRKGSNGQEKLPAGEEEVAAVYNVLRDYVPNCDARAPVDLVRKCRAENPEVPVETICGILEREASKMRAGRTNPLGWLLSTVPGLCSPPLVRVRDLAQSAEDKLRRDRAGKQGNVSAVE